MKVSYTVQMALEDGVPVTLDQFFADEAAASAHVNGIAQALSLVKFRGAVRFYIQQNDVAVLSAVVTFRDDLPNGVWNIVRA